MFLLENKNKKDPHAAAVGHAARTKKGGESRAVITARSSAATPDERV